MTSLQGGVAERSKPEQKRLGLPVPERDDVLEGEVAHVTFANEQSGFRVLQVKPASGGDSVTVVGVMPPAPDGTRVRATGGYVVDKRHGRQFKADTLIALAPSTLEGLQKYLSSGVIPGIGRALAKRIVTKFGDETMTVLDTSPERLREVSGLGATRAQSIANAWEEHREVGAIMVFLQSHGASPALANRIFRRFGGKAVHIVQQAPYRLALEVWGVGFRTADTIARSLGVGLDSPERAQAGLLHTLHEIASNGHCYTPRPDLLHEVGRLLEDDDTDRIERALETLALAGRIGIAQTEAGTDAIMLHELLEAEVRVADRIGRLVQESRVLERTGHAMAEFEKLSGLRLAPSQRDAVQTVAEHKVVVITGGPGVGKTTIVRAVLALFDTGNMRVALAAPTGRAAKRMSEATGRASKTIHRLLEIDPKSRSFLRNDDNPLECDAIIIDESSMLSLELADSLVAAIPSHARVVLVGDVDQLPSVGPGAVLRDVIECGAVPTVRLTEIFRQADGSGIVVNAHRIHEGELPVGSREKDAEFYVFERRDAESAVSLIEHLVAERVPAGFGFDPVTDIQVLTPMQKGPVGAIVLNERLQARLNPEGTTVKRGAKQLRLGDKVMQLSNDYERDVFNGDIGSVVTINGEERELTVRFEGRDVVYSDAAIDNLTLAYATSIHKSQGSEYPAVIIPVLNQHFVMLSRNLLYTAVTRGRKLVILVADPRALRLALGEVRREWRRTLLGPRLARMVGEASGAQ
ncbi:MAG: ATP-dependent RecD-like DNA helicase [Myxococcota bacterium]